MKMPRGTHMQPPRGSMDIAGHLYFFTSTCQTPLHEPDANPICRSGGTKRCRFLPLVPLHPGLAGVLALPAVRRSGSQI